MLCLNRSLLPAVPLAGRRRPEAGGHRAGSRCGWTSGARSPGRRRPPVSPPLAGV